MSIIISDSPLVKPGMWTIDPGVVFGNVSKMGLPMPSELHVAWEGTGNKVWDLSGNANDGQSKGDCYFTTEGLYFDGTDDYVEILNPTFAVGDEISFAFRMRTPTPTKNWMVMVSMSDASRLQLGFSGVTGKLYWSMYVNGVWSSITGTGVNALSANTWYDLVFAYSSGDSAVYINGVVDDTDAAATGTYDLGTNHLWYGQYADDGFDFIGDISYFYVFEKRLNLTQAQTLYVDPFGLVRQPKRIHAVFAAFTTTPPTTLAPTTAVPTTLAPTTSAVTTSAPTSPEPTTSPAATTSPPTTLAPTTLPTTAAPTTIAPTTWQSTAPPTTKPPTTLAPTTLAPTEPPTTLAPTTLPTTAIPTTLAPTALPTTAVPTTVAPTTVAPTTIVTTIAPTTLLTTLAPTTSPPTTLAPTTIAPTVAPTTAAVEVCVLEFDSEIVNVLEFDSDISRILESNSGIVKILEFTSEICKV